MTLKITSIPIIFFGAILLNCKKENPTSTTKENDVLPVQAENTENPFDPYGDSKDEDSADVEIPETLDEALQMMMKNLTDDDRKFIEDAGEDYSSLVHMGGGMGMRNAWRLWGDSALRRYFTRLGIYHADDISSIINKAFSRRVRGKDIKLDDLVKHYRAYWAEQDIIAPLDLKCPHCAKEMEVFYNGPGMSKEHPERPYFSGSCPDGMIFYFYHKDGWRNTEEINNTLKR